MGSRLIDMTAKKMADIFFGKFSELIAPQSKKAKSHDKIETKNRKNNSNLKQNINLFNYWNLFSNYWYYFLA